MNKLFFILLFILSVSLNLFGLIWFYWSNQTLSFERNVYTNVVREKVPEKLFNTVGNPIEILHLPDNFFSYPSSDYLIDDENNHTLYVHNEIPQPVFYKNHRVTFTRFSPSHKQLGFFFYPEDHSLGEIVLAILDSNKRVIEEVYRGDTWTSKWEWKGDKSVIVKRSCGTGCMVASVIDISTGKKIEA